VRGFIDRTIEQARERGYVETMYGRRRMVPELRSKNTQIRQAGERMTVNFPIQGTAADILKRAMLRVHARLASDVNADDQRRARMILTVHDELLVESPAEAADEVARELRDSMEHAAELAVPLTVDVGIGPNWRDAKP
jgi:DNA polymerase-1